MRSMRWPAWPCSGWPRAGGDVILSLYRAAWEPLLVLARLFAAPERLCADLPDRPQEKGGGALWLHAASLGECKGLWAFAETLWSADPHVRLVLTTNTTAGLDFLREKMVLAPNHENRGRGTGSVVRLAPLDHPRVAARLLRAHDVRALVLFEVELWPHWMLAARGTKGRSVPVFRISARVTDRARRRYAGNRFLAAALRRVLGGIAWTQAQTGDEAALLRGLGAPHVEAGGDLRGLYYLDSGESPRTHASHVPDKPRRGLAFVSMHAKELPAIVPSLREGRTDEPIRIFPRKLKELPAFRKALEPLGFALHSEQPDAPRVIVDSFGIVGPALRTARAAVVGGSFLPHNRIGGHNLWEPLLAGASIVVGRRHDNQLYLARRLADAGLLRVARNTVELSDALNAEIERPESLEARENFIANERVLLRQAAARASHTILAVLKKRD
jgi:3-deoxy-D-manno-octulosonic-acid transferase